MVEKLSHIAIILDGNRRYAEKKKWKPWEGHKSGAKNIEKLLDWALELGIKELTLYCFSIENFDRPKKEVTVLMELFKDQLARLEKDKRIEDNKIKVRFIGRLSRFPEDVRKRMEKIMIDTADYDDFVLNFAMGYGGRAEIVDAVKGIVKKRIKDIDEDVINRNLYMDDEPDLVIRTGGEKRVSNFLIWQAYYSEWYFTDKLWPEFTKGDLVKAIDDYKDRKRRYGV